MGGTAATSSDVPFAKPLSGVRVVELGGTGLAGSVTAHLLAEQGAAVTRIDRPGLSPPNRPLERYLNRAKILRQLDLTTHEGRAEAKALLRAADVVIENFRPGVMEGLDFSPEACLRANPALINLGLPGFAQCDPVRRHWAAWEGVLGAACGLFTDVNILRHTLDLPPVYTALPHASIYGAMHGALAVTLALYARQTTGQGDIIEVPLAAAGASAMGSSAMRILPQPRRYDLPEWPRAISRLILPAVGALTKHLPQSWQQSIEALADAAIPALMSSYRCADGQLLYVFAVDHDRIPRALLDELDLWTELHQRGLVCRDPYVPGATSVRKNLADSTRLARRWQARLRKALTARFATQNAAAWEARLTAAGIPCSVQRNTREWMTLPELRAAGIVEQTDSGDLQPGRAAWVTHSVEPTLAPPPNAQPHNQSGPRLAGHLVLDLTTMVAGPVCGRTLAEYGATVIKLDSPHPHHGPRLTCWYGVDVNQGKRSLLLDIGRPQGRELLNRLLDRADLLLHNFSDKACADLHLSHTDLHTTHPHLVVTRIGAYRGPVRGPLDARKGYDPVLQAASGIMRRYGSDAQPVHHGIASCIDYLTGYIAAWAAALGLLERKRSCGDGGEAVTSLAQAALLIQLPFAVMGKDGSSQTAPTGQWAWGENALHRLYRARDGWIFLAAPEAARQRVCTVLRIPEAARLPDRALAATLQRTIRLCRRATLAADLNDDSTTVAPADPLDRLPVTPAAVPGSPLADGETLRMVLSRGPGGEAIRTLAPTYARSRSAPLLQPAPAPRLGADTRNILVELGIGDREIDRLLRAGIASEGLSPRLLPD